MQSLWWKIKKCKIAKLTVIYCQASSACRLPITFSMYNENENSPRKTLEFLKTPANPFCTFQVTLRTQN